MSDNTPEQNSAEAEAEAILREAAAKLDVDGEDCPMGDKCAVHFRNDEEYSDDDEQYGRMITYVGEYAVVSGDNPELENPMIILRALLGGDKFEMPPFYETIVVKVGEGALADVRSLDTEGKRQAIRYVTQFSKWSQFKTTHESTVMGVREGLLDLSKPVVEGDN